jgi:hypothetical protein
VKKHLSLVALLVLCVFPLSAFTNASSLHTNAGTLASLQTAKHCVIKLAPLRPGQHTSDILGSSCYRTFAEAIAAATGGRVHLASTIRPQDLTQAMLNTSLNATSQSQPASNISNTQYILSDEYWDWHDTGATWTPSGSAPCSSSIGYSLSYVGDTWNDQISSATGYSGCNHVKHWDNRGFKGSNIMCTNSPSTCWTMGAMNDHTSSIEWNH